MKFYRFVLIALVALFCCDCTSQQLKSTLSDVGKAAGVVAGYVAEASNDLSILEQLASVFFATKPAPDAQKAFADAVVEARKGLDAASAATDGANELSQEQLAAAFKDFQAAYQKLEALAKDLGIFGAKPGAMAASFPTPRAALVGMKK